MIDNNNYVLKLKPACWFAQGFLCMDIGIFCAGMRTDQLNYKFVKFCFIMYKECFFQLTITR